MTRRTAGTEPKWLTDWKAEHGARIAALNDEMHAEQTDATRFRAYAETTPRPACPPTPADLADLDPEAVYPSLPPAVLLLFAADCDRRAALLAAEITRLLDEHQPTERPRKANR